MISMKNFKATATMRLHETDLWATPGFRLQRFEVFNWGTFDGRVWTIATRGENALITGDIGSGKSTLVDAMTTLLVPPQRIVYNKAAGAESRERSLLSYVRGHYKSEKDDARLSARAVGLRDQSSYSVILGVFHNEHYNETITLAQVFWCTSDSGAPERFYLVATTPLSISPDFAEFGGAIPALKKRLKQQAGVALFDSFSQYGNDFRRRMGIAGEQVLDLFYQTVSMKSVSNITDFVREHMLEAPKVAERIDAMCRNFENLNAAHESVLKAKRQIEHLAPLVADCDQHDAMHSQIALQQRLRDALSAWAAGQKAAFLQRDLQRLADGLSELADASGLQERKVEALYARQAELKRAIADNGGRRLEEIAQQIDGLDQQRMRQKRAFDEHYAPACQALDLPRAQSLPTFHDNRRAAAEREAGLGAQQLKLDARYDDMTVQVTNLNREAGALADEIKSLRQRTSSIPSAMLLLREKLCAALGLAESALPFTGELMQVRAEEARWEGAIERVLHGFGLSLLVAEKHYAALSAYVDSQHLGGRLVYFRVQADDQPAPRPAANTLPGKLEFKLDSPFCDWLRRELERGFDYQCCATLDDFRHYPKALTLQGQIKSGGVRHEKDDRSHIADRTRYVLGWRNEDKIRALEAQRGQLEQRGLALLGQRSSADAQRKAILAQLQAVRDLLRYSEYAEIDWPGSVQAIHLLHEEKRQLESSSDVLRELDAQLAALDAELKRANERRGELGIETGKKKQEQESKQADLIAAQTRHAECAETEQQFCFSRLNLLAPKALNGRLPNTARQCDDAESGMRKWLQERIDAHRSKVENLAVAIARQMQSFRTAYPVECREVDAKPEAAAEYRTMLGRLSGEDLPRFEARFKSMLNEQTINEVALLQNKLEQEEGGIKGKIAAINRSLQRLAYNEGTFIQLIPDANPDIEIRAFRQDLRACLADTLSGAGDDLYSEHKFLQVKAIIDRLRGREGLTELDKRWKQKVSDVRNWSLFSASERWREDNTEREFYSDSAGKSGGQKEKLAYTILASALVYQYGIEQQARTTRAFRFVMIDEAFGRGSDESARYGLELFRQLGLQLLIVTPLQKIHVIEDYVQSVHLVHNSEGRESMIRSLTLAEYRAEKAQHHAEVNFTR